jgi:hypothetical protein
MNNYWNGEGENVPTPLKIGFFGPKEFAPYETFGSAAT